MKTEMENDVSYIVMLSGGRPCHAFYYINEEKINEKESILRQSGWHHHVFADVTDLVTHWQTFPKPPKQIKTKKGR